jgi:hypothetical protein
VVESKWVEASATVRDCGLDEYHPFASDGGGVVYSLRCRLQYSFASRAYEYKLHTTSDRSADVRSDIENWAAEHPAGTILAVRVNPSNAAEVDVVTPLPVHQHNTARDALITMLIFLALGGSMWFVGRKLSHRH